VVFASALAPELHLSVRVQNDESSGKLSGSVSLNRTGSSGHRQQRTSPASMSSIRRGQALQRAEKRGSVAGHASVDRRNSALSIDERRETAASPFGKPPFRVVF
jgi:hypothetical protein